MKFQSISSTLTHPFPCPCVIYKSTPVYGWILQKNLRFSFFSSQPFWFSRFFWIYTTGMCACQVAIWHICVFLVVDVTPRVFLLVMACSFLLLWFTEIQKSNECNFTAGRSLKVDKKLQTGKEEMESEKQFFYLPPN